MGAIFEPAKEIDYITVRRLDIPEVGAKYGLRTDVQERLQKLSALSRGEKKCYRCNNSGVCQWKAKGDVAVVCECVRAGALLELSGEELFI